jgi:hypothetical protein
MMTPLARAVKASMTRLLRSMLHRQPRLRPGRGTVAAGSDRLEQRSVQSQAGAECEHDHRVPLLHRPRGEEPLENNKDSRRRTVAVVAQDSVRRLQARLVQGELLSDNLKNPRATRMNSPAGDVGDPQTVPPEELPDNGAHMSGQHPHVGPTHRAPAATGPSGTRDL